MDDPIIRAALFIRAVRRCHRVPVIVGVYRLLSLCHVAGQVGVSVDASKAISAQHRDESMAHQALA